MKKATKNQLILRKFLTVPGVLMLGQIAENSSKMMNSREITVIMKKILSLRRC